MRRPVRFEDGRPSAGGSALPARRPGSGAPLPGPPVLDEDTAVRVCPVPVRRRPPPEDPSGRTGARPVVAPRRDPYRATRYGSRPGVRSRPAWSRFTASGPGRR
ncbi:hypothetical protein Shyhy02_81370 [Streptomyces hygroscopicus subsp. hygroscopicus]|nr:hypothetical protein Shyhy02_81370 [Streptomyces hygroscopicus subsp. hygroscopicus]